MQSSTNVQASTQKAKRPSKEPDLVIQGDTLKDEPHMIATVAACFMGAAILLVQAGLEVQTPVTAGLCLLATGAGITAADIFSGMFHFGADNYGNGKTPIFGSVIEAFQGHHSSPWTITYRPFANNIYKIGFGVIPLMSLLALAHPGPAGTVFGVTFLIASLLCQEIHKYSHMISPPAAVRALQDSGLILSRKAHGAHHSSPFESNYCIVTGHCNEFLDNLGIWRWLERVIYETTGVKSNTWKLDPQVMEDALR